MVRRVLRRTRRASSVPYVLVLLVLLVSWNRAEAYDPVLDPLRDLFARTITRFVTRSFRGTLEVGTLRGSLLGAPVLQQITLRDEQGTVVGQIAELRLVYDLKALLKKRLKIQTLELVQLQLTLAPTPDGGLNILSLLSPATPGTLDTPEEPSKGGTFALEVENLHIRDGALTLHFPALPGAQKLEGIQARLSAQLDEEKLRLQVQQLTAHASPADLEIRTLQGALQKRGDVMQLEDVRLQTGQATLIANGVFPGGMQDASLTLHAQSQDLTEIGRLVQNDILQGPADLILKAEGPPEAVEISSQLSSTSGHIAFQGHLNAAAMPPHYSGTLDVANLNLAALRQQGAWHSDLSLQLRVAGAGISPQERHGTVQLEIRPSRLREIALHPSYIDLEVKAQQVQVQRFDLNTSIAHTTVTGMFDLTGTLDMQYVFTANLVEWQSLVGITALAGNVHTQGQISGTWPALGGRGALEVRNLQYQDHAIDSLRLTYEGSQLGSQPQLAAQLLVRHARAGTLPIEQVTLDVTYPGAEGQVQFATEVVQSAKSGGRARGTLTRDNAGQQLVLEELQIQLPDRTWHAAAPLQVAFGPQRLDITQIHLVHDDESIKLSGAVHGDELQDIQLHATHIDLSYIHQLLHLPDVIGGRATFQAQLTGTRTEPRFESELTMQPAASQRLPFTQLHNTLVYGQRQLQSTGRLHQGTREIVALDVRLPLDLALTAMPLGQRLLEAPLAVHMRLQQPHLAHVHQWQPNVPRLEGTLEGSVDLQGTYTALTLDARAQLQQLKIEGIAAQIRGSLHLHGAFTTAPSMAELAQAIDARQMTPQVPKLVLQIPALRGLWLAPGSPGEPWQVENLLLQAMGQWTADGPQATLQDLHLHVNGFGMPRTEVQLAGQWSPSRLDLTRLHVRQPQSELRAQGHLTLPEQQVQFRLDMPRLHLASLPLSLPPTLPPVLQGTLSVRGRLQAPEVEVLLQYAGGRIHADLSAQLQEALPRYRATLRVDGLALAQVLPQAQGSLQARLQLQGRGWTGERRQGTLDATVETTGFNLAPGLTTRLRATLVGTALQLEQLQVRSTVAELTASGTLSTSSKATLQYRLTLGDLAPLQPLLGVPLQARGDLSGEVQGPLNALRTRGALQLGTWRVADLSGQRLQATFTATQIPAAPQATLRAQLMKVQGPTLAPSSVSLEGTYAAQQGTFTVAVTEGPYQRSMLAGNVSLAAGQRLTLKTLRLHHQDLRWENAAPVEIMRSPQGVLQIRHFDLRSGPQAIRLQGTLDPQGVTQGEVQVQQLQLRPVIQVFAPDLDISDGRLDLALTLAGTWQRPQAQGKLSLTALQWQKRQFGDIQATVGLSNRTLQTDVQWQIQESPLLQVRSTMRLDAARALDVRIQAPRVNLDMLGPLSPAVQQSAGLLTLDLHVTGTLQQPQVRGELLLRDGVLQLAAIGERYQDIQVHLIFAGDRVTIERLQLASRSGPLQVTGWFEHADLALRQVSMAVSARNFTAIRTPAVEAAVSADIAVRGTLQAVTATGSVTVPSARLRLDQIPGSGPKIVQPWELTIAGVYGPGPKALGTGKGPAAVPTSRDLPLPFVRADLQIDMPRNVWLQGPSTAIELSGNMRVTKDLRAPFILSGNIETVRGYASYYGKRFTVERGHVTFTGTPEINPMLDVTVAQKVSEYLVSIKVTGRAQQPTIAFSSNPELPQADIISLLVLGKTTDRLTKSEHNSLADEAQQLAGGFIAGQLEKTLGKSLGLDTIEINSGEQLGTGSVKAGRYVTQDLFLSLEREFGRDSGMAVGLEYSLTRRLKVRGSSSDQGATALDFLWRLDY
jgi:autotransporter translocation and assembly factor TamB